MGSKLPTFRSLLQCPTHMTAHLFSTYSFFFGRLCAVKKSDSVKFLAHPLQQIKLKCVLTLTDVSLVLKSRETPVRSPLACGTPTHTPTHIPHTCHTYVCAANNFLSFLSCLLFRSAPVVVVHCFNDARKS